MNQDWQDFLMQQGAQPQEGVVQHFGDLPAELLASRDRTVLCDLSQFGILKVSGDEAQKFLQNLLSNDITAVNAKTAQLSSFNSPKGRMMATFLIWQNGGDYFLQLPRSLTAAMLKRLSMYVMRAKVKISDASDEMVCLGLSGNDAADLVKQHFSAALQQDWEVAQHDDVSVIRIASNRFQICTTVQHASVLWSSMAAAAKPAGSACWDWLNIRAGIPVITPATQEQFVLQMSNLDILGGVSFNKGCYPGQEIVARTHYLGKQKRRMFLAHIESDSAVAAGHELFSPDMPGQACGMIVNASPAPGGGFDLLAVMQISSHDTQSVHFQSLQGAKLSFLPLPYPLPIGE
ncbi:MAG TPA: folate-binding protein YgfZ [Gallionellaceae bacterium]|nr:folate-binding protein YgfZ [Gallionellaceae bacterium]